MSLKLSAELKNILFLTALSAVLAMALGYLVEDSSYLSDIIAASLPTFLSGLASFAIYRIATAKKLSAGNGGVLCLLATIVIFGLAALLLPLIGLNSLFGTAGLLLFGVIIGTINLIRICGRMLDDKREEECKGLLLEVEKINESYIKAHGKEIPHLEQNLEAVYQTRNSRYKKMLIERLLKNIRAL